MKIKEMFAKSIDRDIQGVVKVGQDNRENIKQELEEYVVTKELQKHFKDFFGSYKKSIIGHTDKMGVWISGFFGSGKSHFLKILSYLLKNRKVEGKRALDYFLDDKKIDDPAIIEDMKLACSIPTDVILFNIDSKSKSAGIRGKDNILNVFLRVFNEMQGFSTDPHLADLERQLTEDGLYEKFKDIYEKLHNLNWVENRHKFKFHRDKVVEALVDIGFMSEKAAKDWNKTTIMPYEINIEGFAKLVKKYIDSKNENHHIVFLVDEMGQYIGDDIDLMLNLQTITEDLGTFCDGKVWIIVTSQQDIDSITEVVGEDFSKIQDRFDTRLNLTSANVDEVIKLRILQKTEIAKETLNIIYENNETVIKNLIIFDSAVEEKLYKNKKDFCNVYPFVPYQFNLLGSVLTSIRQHGASGKHLSEGERSLLALFKEGAEKVKNKGDGEIVPFNIFYDGLNKFLDHSHSAVITKALENEYINPGKEKDNFNVNVLKTLFMIKYVKEIEASLENITTLMISNINEDRIRLKDKVKKALNILVKQTLVQKNGDLYIFLTDEEQEINRMIERQRIETQAITKKISEIIYAGIFSEDKVNYDRFGNRYNFGFNKFVDGEPYRIGQSFDIGTDIITPNSEKNGIDSILRMNSQRENKIYIDLPNDRAFIDEIRIEMKIEKYLNMSSVSNIPKLEKIKALKRIEMREHQERAKFYLEEALKEAKFYLNGDRLEFKGSNFRSNMQESLKKLIETVYHKLNYIDTPVDYIEIKKLFKNKKNGNIQLNVLKNPNENALMEVLEYIKLRTRNHNRISIKEIKEKFSKAPYGFLDVDIEWIITKLFLDGNIGFTLYGETISLFYETEEEIINYITKRQYAEKLLIEEKKVIDERYIRSLKNVSSAVFGVEIQSEDIDTMTKKFNEYAGHMIDELNTIKINYDDGEYPSKNVIVEGINLINRTRCMSNSMDIFKYLNKNEDEYLDFEKHYQPIKSFFEGNQKNIWDKTQHYISIYNESRSYILNREIENITDNMKNILSMSNPYNRIKDLPELNDRFLNLYNDILDEELKPVKDEIGRIRDRIMEELKKTDLENKFEHRYENSFNNLIKKAESCNSIAIVNGFMIEADTLKKRYLKEISEEIERQKETEKSVEGKGIMLTKPPVIKRKYVSIKDINPSNSWTIKTKKDLDRYLKELKEKLEKELEEDTILNIEF